MITKVGEHFGALCEAGDVIPFSQLGNVIELTISINMVTGKRKTRQDLQIFPVQKDQELVFATHPISISGRMHMSSTDHCLFLLLTV